MRSGDRNLHDELKERRKMVGGEESSKSISPKDKPVPKKFDPARLQALQNNISLGGANQKPENEKNASSPSTFASQQPTGVGTLNPNKVAAVNKSARPSTSAPIIPPVAPSIAPPIAANGSAPPPPPPPPPGAGVPRAAVSWKDKQIQNKHDNPTSSPSLSSGSRLLNNHPPAMAEVFNAIKVGVPLRASQDGKKKAEETGQGTSQEGKKKAEETGQGKGIQVLLAKSSLSTHRRTRYNSKHDDSSGASEDEWRESEAEPSLESKKAKDFTTPTVNPDYDPSVKRMGRVVIKRLTDEERAKKLAEIQGKSASPSASTARNFKIPPRATDTTIQLTSSPATQPRPRRPLPQTPPQTPQAMDVDRPPIAPDTTNQPIKPPANQATNLGNKLGVDQEKIGESLLVKADKSTWFIRNLPWIVTLAVNVLLVGAGVAVGLFVPPVGAVIVSYAGLNVIGLVAGTAVASAVSYTVALATGLAIASAVVTALNWAIFGIAKGISKLIKVFGSKKSADNDNSNPEARLKDGNPSRINNTAGILGKQGGPGRPTKNQDEVSDIAPANSEHVCAPKQVDASRFSPNTRSTRR